MGERLIGRRESLKYLGMLAGNVAGREFLAGWLATSTGAQASVGQVRASFHESSLQPTERPFAPLFFKLDEFRVVEMLTELIIPTDESPGAKEAQVAAYIDFIVSAAAEYDASLQHAWTEGLKLLDRLSREKYERDFREISTREKEMLLGEMSLPEHQPHQTHPGYEFYRLIKEMTVEGFYTSRVGLIDVLGYQGLGALSEFPGCTHPEHQT